MERELNSNNTALEKADKGFDDSGYEAKDFSDSVKKATEGEKNVPDSVITGWYKSVYEPTFTAKPAETGK